MAEPAEQKCLLCNVVDAAYQEDDPHRRIAFVAAFAMSNYSSTIGRIAKPFNPMLVSLVIRTDLCVYLQVHRAKHSNTCVMTRSTVTCQNKLAITRQYQRAGPNLLCGDTTAR